MENVYKYGVLVAPKTIFNKFKGTNRSFKNNFFLSCLEKNFGSGVFQYKRNHLNGKIHKKIVCETLLL
jgi:hypothetical protein